ncbi:hypothetical protein SDRG_03536 [Saprolegnia diclina VS20]|uniref:Uncharacterized protein n=1 Tax=Saprolegnia diclina (strain VS20) TaxID=1156394 RepID=T0QXB9_SAPDV|nr:hypothetical protein SDRG_03536 [Saprolegnia diclina VS20]EQC39331.1 hypothetical protein SDRG_03536 [Saprolegnia diclina VS20]|eukprot:XP_008607392.1 hypothetical protein SDRG_03536 [Saprolegnia diclina VS20]
MDAPSTIHCDCPVGSSELKLHGANCSLALLKCPWQWREPFLDERRAKLKRKVGDGYLCDPVDPAFVDQLLPGSVTKLFRVVEQDEQSQIQIEIQRLNEAKASARDHTSKWDHDDGDVGTRKALPAGSESPITVAAPVCSGEELAYLDSILLSNEAPNPVSSPSAITDTEAISRSTLEEPLLQLLSDRYETYLNYDEEELNFAENDLQPTRQPTRVAA